MVNIIYAYDYNDGELSNRRVFVDALALGLPEGTFADGICIDSEGGVWSARHVAHPSFSLCGLKLLDGEGPELFATRLMSQGL